MSSFNEKISVCSGFPLKCVLVSVCFGSKEGFKFLFPYSRSSPFLAKLKANFLFRLWIPNVDIVKSSGEKSHYFYGGRIVDNIP